MTGTQNRPTRKFFSPDRFAKGNLKDGEKFSINSGLGGSFTVRYDGWDDNSGRGRFRVTDHDFKGLHYAFNPERAAQVLFVLVHKEV